MASIKNPLYVVTNEGKDVEGVANYIELVIKKLGLEPYLDLLESMIAMITNQVGNYGFFIALQNLVDHIAEQIEKMLEFASRII
ncbi:MULTISPECIES: hypothetical protein [Halobacteriovorax]|uniref:Uncharacterized protein n=1 Tax=Halobacteriovorax vibrionivorans TaxID=2152716 RepID=A0ABY0IBU6_9BACT|nr:MULTISPECIES: hypothetical protein [Halobacteriovorax]AYF44334.1 hypothetical protein BALOs_1331 [Halobacteriovorax sp. BALOs_7]RZF20421.1 hypothetical protein DAY19_14765 [Halobacteriovorax vibrionivorans]TGD46594.1 hypothetical protein EP118_11525 [Halobacteriovorax sp. Y22]